MILEFDFLGYSYVVIKSMIFWYDRLLYEGKEKDVMMYFFNDFRDEF